MREQHRRMGRGCSVVVASAAAATLARSPGLLTGRGNRHCPLAAAWRHAPTAKRFRTQRAVFEEEEEIEGWAGQDLQDDLLLQEELARVCKTEKRRKEIAQQAGHYPVQVVSVVEKLFDPRLLQQGGGFGGTYVDGTFGRGGHSRAILSQLSDNARLFAFDVDPTAVTVGHELEHEDDRFRIFHSPFGEMANILDRPGSVDGVLLDVGVANAQVDDKGRGFRVNDSPDSPLDMRMNQEQGISAAEWLAGTSAEELAWVIREYADQSDPLMASRIAEMILDHQRCHGPFRCARSLAEAIQKIRDSLDDRSRHSAKLTFQAIRMFLNHELDQLRLALDAAFHLLRPGGRCLVLTFKKSETSTVREFLRDHEEPDERLAKVLSPARLGELYPLVASDLDYSVSLLSYPLRPRGVEVSSNVRSQTSKLMLLKKTERSCPQIREAGQRDTSEQFRRPRPPPFLGAVAPAECGGGAL